LVPVSAIQLLVSIYLAGGGVLLSGGCCGRCGRGRIHCSGGRGRDSRLRSGFIYPAVSIYINQREGCYLPLTVGAALGSVGVVVAMVAMVVSLCVLISNFPNRIPWEIINIHSFQQTYSSVRARYNTMHTDFILFFSKIQTLFQQKGETEYGTSPTFTIQKHENIRLFPHLHLCTELSQQWHMNYRESQCICGYLYKKEKSE
jgi:hypothetical protein